MRKLRRDKRGAVMYIFAVILVGLVVVPVAWYILMYNVVNSFKTSANTVIFALGTNSTQHGYVDSFFSNLITYILVLFLFGVAWWAYTYAQRARGTVYVQ